jgi:ribosome-associated protein
VIRLSQTVVIEDDELEWSYARSGGPGGQNVNKVASKAHLRWRMARNTSVPEAAKARLRASHPSLTTVEGDLLVTSQEYRDQERNRTRCVEKLTEMVTSALREPKKRKVTKPSKGAQRRRLEDKKQQSSKKATRRVGRSGGHDD